MGALGGQWRHFPRRVDRSHAPGDARDLRGRFATGSSAGRPTGGWRICTSRCGRDRRAGAADIGAADVVLCAAPAYLPQRRAPRPMAELARHDLARLIIADLGARSARSPPAGPRLAEPRRSALRWRIADRYLLAGPFLPRRRRWRLDGGFVGPRRLLGRRLPPRRRLDRRTMRIRGPDGRPVGGHVDNTLPLRSVPRKAWPPWRAARRVTGWQTARRCWTEQPFWRSDATAEYRTRRRPGPRGNSVPTLVGVVCIATRCADDVITLGRIEAVKARIVRIGNSQGVRIPKPLLEQARK